MGWSALARALGALIDLVMLEKQLDILELTKDKAYELADKQVLLAELIIALHCNLLAKTNTYHSIANSSPTYDQQHSCAMDLANIDVIRESNRAMNDGLDTTGMYSAGLRRDYIESAMEGVVFSSSGQWAMAYRNEDDLHNMTVLNKYKHMIDSISAGSVFTAHATMGRLAQNTVDLAESTSRLVENHLGSFVTGATDWAAGPSKNKSSNTSISSQVKAGGDVTLPSGEVLPVGSFTDRATDRQGVRELVRLSGTDADSELNNVILNTEVP